MTDTSPVDRSIRATYEAEAAARRAVDAARRAGLTADIGGKADERAVLRAEMRDEMESAVVGPGPIGPFTKGMSKGIALWVPIGAVIGALLGLLLGVIPWGQGLSLGLRLVLGIVIGAGFAATVGFVAGGSVRPVTEGEGEKLDAEVGTTVTVRVGNDDESRRAREILERSNPLRIDETDDWGATLGPSSEEATRPVRGEPPG